MMYFRKIIGVALNPVFTGKALAAGTQLLVVLLSIQMLESYQANILYSLLSVSAILTALASFGANGALVPFLYRHQNKTMAILIILLTGKLAIVILGAIIFRNFKYFSDLPPWLVAWTAFSSALLFIDYVAESRGNVEVERISKIKFWVFGIGLIIKLAFFYLSFQMVLYTLYAEWLIVWVAYLISIRGSIQEQSVNIFEDLRLVCKFLISSCWVWVSTVVSFGWTRAYFFMLGADIGIDSANVYFIVVRLIEGFTLIPNSLAMRFFPDMVSRNHDGDVAGLQAIRCNYIRRTTQASLLASAVIMLLIITINGGISWLGQNPAYHVMQLTLISITAFLVLFRVALSREIILTGRLFLSVASYISGAALSFAVYRLMGADDYLDALVGYLFFALGSLVGPFILAPRKLQPFRDAFVALLKNETRV